MIRTAGEETTNTHHIMKKSFLKNTNYTSPEVELLGVCFEGSILQTSNYGSSQAAGQDFSSGNGNILDYTDGDDF